MSVCSRIVIVKKNNIKKTKVAVGGIVEKNIWRFKGWLLIKREKIIVPEKHAKTNNAIPKYACQPKLTKTALLEKEIASIIGWKKNHSAMLETIAIINQIFVDVLMKICCAKEYYLFHVQILISRGENNGKQNWNKQQKQY